MDENKPVIGFTMGDVNGIGPELLVKLFSDNRIFDFCTPVVFGSNKVLIFYRKGLGDGQISYNILKEEEGHFHPRQVNIFPIGQDEVQINPGELTDAAGSYAVLSLNAASMAMKKGIIHGLITPPLHKKNVYSEKFPHTGHTPFLRQFFEAKDVLMFMVAENMRVGLLSEHVAIKDAAAQVTRENILSKLQLMNESLKRDFGISKPKIAVLGLNPHAGDDGLIGNEEETIVKPTLTEAEQKGILAFGPYPADAFFARSSYTKFDAVLAMYHDQGLIPFKSLAIGEGVNFTAGLNVVRTSPDHGTAFDIAGKGIADESSIREALFTCIDIVNMRREIKEQRKNPLRKVSAAVLKNAVDEKVEE